jgi:hypothetical protein
VWSLTADQPTVVVMQHRKAVSAAIQDDGRLRFRLGLGVLTSAVILIAIVTVFANHSSSVTTPAETVKESRNEPKPSPVPPPEVPAPLVQKSATPPVALAQQVGPEDHELHEDGRVYSVAVVTGTSEIPVGAKLFVQGRVGTFDYASGMRSRPFVILEDEKQPRKTMLCGMTEDEGREVFALYHVGEIVAVSGEYIATASINDYRYPTMPLFSGCKVADSQNNVVRPAEITQAAQAANGETRLVPTQPEDGTNRNTGGSRTGTSVTTPSPRLQFESGVRMMIRVDSMTRQSNGGFVFRGTLLLPITLSDGHSLDQHTQLAGSGMVESGHLKGPHFRVDRSGRKLWTATGR